MDARCCAGVWRRFWRLDATRARQSEGSLRGAGGGEGEASAGNWGVDWRSMMRMGWGERGREEEKKCRLSYRSIRCWDGRGGVVAAVVWPRLDQGSDEG